MAISKLKKCTRKKCHEFKLFIGKNGCALKYPFPKEKVPMGRVISLPRKVFAQGERERTVILV